MKEILTIANKTHTAFLGKPTREVDLAALDRTVTRALIKEMRETMRAASGAGLSANQIGLDMRLFVAEVPDRRLVRVYGGESRRVFEVYEPDLDARRARSVADLEHVPDFFGLDFAFETLDLFAQLLYDAVHMKFYAIGPLYTISKRILSGVSKVI